MQKKCFPIPRKRDLIKILGWGAGTFAALYTFQIHGHFSLNKSDSLPGRFFYVSNFKPHFPLQVGELVTFKHHTIPVTLLKKVAGVPGEKVTHINGMTYVEGRPIGAMLSRTKDGKALHPGFTGTIPEGYLFVAGSHPRSFDSRYQELGLIQEESILSKAWPLL